MRGGAGPGSAQAEVGFSKEISRAVLDDISHWFSDSKSHCPGSVFRTVRWGSASHTHSHGTESPSMATPTIHTTPKFQPDLSLL